MRTIAAVLVALTATFALAEQPSRDAVTQPLYVLRAYVFPNSPAAYQGIFRYDQASKTYTSFAPFNYNASANSPNGANAVHLGSTADRIIVQSSAYYEFELTTGRLLRRYDSSDAAQDGYVFHGTVVTEEQAQSLGITAGIYGFPLCTYFIQSDPVSTTCTPRQFPGYAAPTLSPFSVLLRRSLDPADTTLTAVKVIGPASSMSGAVALDTAHHQFWMWGGAGQWATLPVSGGTIGDPIPVAVGTPNTILDVASLTVHEPSQMLFDIVELPSTQRQFLKQATNDVTSSSTLETILPSDVAQPRTDAVTAIPSALPARYVQMIPAIGELFGVNNTFWRSDLWLYNPADTDIDVTMRRVVRPDQTSVRHVPAHGSLAIHDVLNVLGGGAAGDGVTLDALVIGAPYRWGAQLSAYSRTFTNGSDGGTYGQSVPAVPSTVGYSTHALSNPANPSIFNGTADPGTAFVIDTRQTGRFRHNIGVVNDGATRLSLTVSSNSQISFYVAPHSVATINLESLFTVSQYTPILVTADRPAPIWMSVIDNISEDAMFVPFELFPLASDASTEMAIPAVATTAGIGGTSWRTDLFGILPTTTPGATTLATTHLDASGGCTADAQLVADGRYIFSDVARQFGACSSNGSVIGALRVSGSTWMAGYSRTYTTRADGGTFGDMLPFYPPRGWPVQHFSGIDAGGRFRINVGLYNGQNTPTTNRLLLYDASGALLAQQDITLAPHASMQSPIAALLHSNIPPGLYGLTVIPQGEGRSWAYVSLVDNISGDPTNLW